MINNIFTRDAAPYESSLFGAADIFYEQKEELILIALHETKEVQYWAVVEFFYNENMEKAREWVLF